MILLHACTFSPSTLPAEGTYSDLTVGFLIGMLTVHEHNKYLQSKPIQNPNARGTYVAEKCCHILYLSYATAGTPSIQWGICSYVYLNTYVCKQALSSRVVVKHCSLENICSR